MNAREALQLLKQPVLNTYEELQAARDTLAVALDERDALWALLVEWLRNGRFWVAGTPELDDLVERTLIVTKEAN